MKTFKLLFAVVALFLSQSATAQSDLTPEETAFLKSLNGKWSRSDAGWGNAMYDISLMYYKDGFVKVGCFHRFDEEWSETKVVDSYYNKLSKTLEISYNVFMTLCTDCEEVKVEMRISSQNDIDDMMLVNVTRTFAGVTNTYEEIYYKC